MNEDQAPTDQQLIEADMAARQLIITTAMLTAKSCNAFNMPTPPIPEGDGSEIIRLDAVCKMAAYMNFPTEELCEQENWSDYNPSILSDPLFLETCVWTPEMCEVLLFSEEESARVDTFNEAQRRGELLDMDPDEYDDDDEDEEVEYNAGTDLMQMWVLALAWGYATANDWIEAVQTVSDPEHLTLPPIMRLG